MNELDRIKKELGQYLPRDTDNLGPILPKSKKVLNMALPLDSRDWFLDALGALPLRYQWTAQRIIVWIFKDIRKLKIDLTKVERIRKARVEWFIETITENLPSMALMAHITEETMKLYLGYSYQSDLIECLCRDIKADKDRVVVSVGLCHKSGAISNDDLDFMLRMTRPVPSFVQSILLDFEQATTGEESSPPEQGEIPDLLTRE